MQIRLKFNMSGNQFSFKECNLISYGQLGSHTSSSPLFFDLLLSITQKGNLPTDVLSLLFLKWSTIWEAVIHSFYSRIPDSYLLNVNSFFFPWAWARTKCFTSSIRSHDIQWIKVGKSPLLKTEQQEQVISVLLTQIIDLLQKNCGCTEWIFLDIN